MALLTASSHNAPPPMAEEGFPRALFAPVVLYVAVIAPARRSVVPFCVGVESPFTEPVSAQSSIHYYFQDLLCVFLHTPSRTCFSRPHIPTYPSKMHEFRYKGPPSILRYPALGGCVVTRSIPDADLHGHRPAVKAPAYPFSSFLRHLTSLRVRSLLQIMLTTISPLAVSC